MKDLIVLTACSQIEHAVRGILTRTESLRIRQPTFDVYVHPHKDPGCLREAATFLRAQAGRYRNALVVFDHEGCGKDAEPAETLEDQVETAVSASGWSDRVGAVVIVPELEIWVWSPSPVVEQACGWSGRIPSLRQWISDSNLECSENGKPIRPKEVLNMALREVGKTRSSALFRAIAERVSVARCTDRAFLKLSGHLQTWFGVLGNVAADAQDESPRTC